MSRRSTQVVRAASTSTDVELDRRSRGVRVEGRDTVAARRKPREGEKTGVRKDRQHPGPVLVLEGELEARVVGRVASRQSEHARAAERFRAEDPSAEPRRRADAQEEAARAESAWPASPVVTRAPRATEFAVRRPRLGEDAVPEGKLEGRETVLVARGFEGVRSVVHIAGGQTAEYGPWDNEPRDGDRFAGDGASSFPMPGRRRARARTNCHSPEVSLGFLEPGLYGFWIGYGVFGRKTPPFPAGSEVIIEEGAEDVVITVPGRILGIDDWRAVGIELEIGERTIERSVHDGGLFIVYPAGGSVGELRVKEGTETLTAFPAATGRFENIEIAEEGL